MKKKILSGILTVCMVVTMTPAMAFASTGSTERAPAAPADPVGPDTVTIQDYSSKKTAASETGPAELNGENYVSVQAALNAANEGETVTLLRDTNESVVIGDRVILDLNGFTLYTDIDSKTITVTYSKSGDRGAVIQNGEVYNIAKFPSTLKSAIYSMADVEVNNVSMMISGVGYETYQGAALYAEEGTAIYNNCEIFYDKAYADESDYIDGAYVDVNATARFNSCSIESLGGDCAYVNGSAEFTGCYLAADGEYSSAVYLGENAKNTKINSGYYYGDTPLYSDTSRAACKIYEGEFSSAYEDVPVVDGSVSGYANAFAKATVSGKNIISTPLNNWKTADTAYIFNGVAAPATVKANLTAVNGQQAGYDDIKVTWTAVKGSTADGYRVNYKKGTGAYVNGKFYKGAGSRTVANLDDGYKYTFQVTPYVVINDDIFTAGTKCFSNKSKTAYTYTLKKVVLNNFSKSGTKVKVTWKNINGETGYQISRAAKQNGTNIVATFATTTGTSKLINADKGKTYYYKVRAYKTVNGTKIFGPWSAAKKFKR